MSIGLIEMNWNAFNQATNTLSWLIIAYLALQPAIKRGMLKQGRHLTFQSLERERKSRVIALIHRKETVNLLGFPVVQYLDIQDSEQVLRAIRLTPDDMPIDFIIHTPSGLSLAAEQVARALSRHKAKVTVFVPHYAMSGGTLLALAADEIVMCPDAILGAVDPTVGQYPASSVISLMDRKRPDQLSDSSFILLDQAKKAVRQTQQLVASLLRRQFDELRAAEIAEILTGGRWTQDYPISVEDLREFGLSVSNDMPADVLRLMSLFPQDGRQRPSVDFIPLPYAPAPQPQPIQAPQK